MPAVYKLINPVNLSVYYVGFTEREPMDRLIDHIINPTHPTSRLLAKSKIKPLMEIIEEGSDVNLERETYWIKKLYAEGNKLENSTGIITAEHLRRKTRAALAPTLSENQRLRIALQEILDELPMGATFPIVVRIKYIAENALKL